VTAAASALQGARIEDLEAIRSLRAGQLREAAALEREAHDALDRREYDAAVAKHREAVALRGKVASGRERESKLLGELAGPLVRALGADTLEDRDRAFASLLTLGPAAIPAIEAAVRGSEDAEVRARVGEAIARLRAQTPDFEGLHRQWASEARASSEYGAADWSARQAAGPPDTASAGDQRTAWASREQDAGEEWLELEYERAVRATHVRIHQTYNPGAVVRVEVADASGAWHVAWSGRDANREAPAWLTIGLAPAKFATRRVRITLDSAGVPGWNEIDAVELIGEPAR
jgi:hypothetical protein